MSVIAVAQYSIVDFNDIDVSDDPPLEPNIGQLWMDSSQEPNLLMRWDGAKWVPTTHLSLEELDPDQNQKINDLDQYIIDLSSDNVVTPSERINIKEKITTIIGFVPTDTGTIPTGATLDAGTKGEYYALRKEARDVSLPTDNAEYVAFETAYNNLSGYLNNLTPRPWNTDPATTTNINVTNTVWRNQWWDYDDSLLNLRQAIANYVKERIVTVEDDIVKRVTYTEVGRVSPRQLIRNSAFRSDFEYWSSVSDLYWEVDTTRKFEAENTAKVSVTGLDVDRWFSIMSNFVPCESGQEFTLSVSSFVEDRTTFDFGFTMEIEWFDANETRISITSGSILPSTNAQWEFFEITGIAPPLTSTVRARFHPVRNGTGWIGKPMFQIGPLATPHELFSDVDAALLPIDARLKTAEQRIQNDAIVSTVMDSVAYQQDLGSKADTTALGDLATKGELSDLETSIPGMIDGKIDEIDFSVYSTKTELQQTADAFDFKFSKGGGVNLIKNSVGFGSFEAWTVNSASANISVTNNEALTSLGFGSGFRFLPAGAARYITQDIFVTPDMPITFSWMVEKTNVSSLDGVLYFQIRNGTTTLASSSYGNSVITTGFEANSLTVTPTVNKITIRVYADANVNATATGLMLNTGELALQWTMAPGELYNSNVLFDLRGIKVSQKDADGVVRGYTQISPEEFAGYWNSNGDGSSYEKVFYLNEEETVTKKLRAHEEFTLGTIKVIQINSATNSGWAFVPSSTNI